MLPMDPGKSPRMLQDLDIGCGEHRQTVSGLLASCPQPYQSINREDMLISYDHCIPKQQMEYLHHTRTTTVAVHDGRNRSILHDLCMIDERHDST